MNSSEQDFVIAAEAGGSIRSFEDISSVIGACYGSSGLLLTESDVSPEFFDLRSGLAGELFQKCSNYQIRLALVVSQPEKYGERVLELAFEHRRHPLIRFFEFEQDARAWLRG